MKFNIFVPKESRANEQRVSLIPEDVAVLVNEGHKVFMEQNAGTAAQFSDKSYEAVGAQVRKLSSETLAGYQQLFQGINLVVRVKRPNHNREHLENQALPQGCIMIGALDPFEQNSTHIREYQERDFKI